MLWKAEEEDCSIFNITHFNDREWFLCILFCSYFVLHIQQTSSKWTHSIQYLLMNITPMHVWTWECECHFYENVYAWAFFVMNRNYFVYFLCSLCFSAIVMSMCVCAHINTFWKNDSQFSCIFRFHQHHQQQARKKKSSRMWDEKK